MFLDIVLACDFTVNEIIVLLSSEIKNIYIITDRSVSVIYTPSSFLHFFHLLTDTETDFPSAGERLHLFPSHSVMVL